MIDEMIDPDQHRTFTPKLILKLLLFEHRRLRQSSRLGGGNSISEKTRRYIDGNVPRPPALNCPSRGERTSPARSRRSRGSRGRNRSIHRSPGTRWRTNPPMRLPRASLGRGWLSRGMPHAIQRRVLHEKLWREIGDKNRQGKINRIFLSRLSSSWIWATVYGWGGDENHFVGNLQKYISDIRLDSGLGRMCQENRWKS
jgi:hypothetical protein